MNASQITQFEREPEEREENLMTDFEEYIETHLHLQRSNYLETPDMLIYKIEGQEITVKLGFLPITEYNQLNENPLERLTIAVMAPEELYLISQEIYPNLFDKFLQAMRNVYYMSD